MKRSKILLGLAALACAMSVAGCDTIRALPQNYNDPIMNVEGGTKLDVYNNIMSQLYDQIAEGKTDKVHEEIINIIAIDQIGSYSELKELVGGASIDDAKVKDFVAKHKDVYVRAEDEELAKATSKSVDEIQKQRVINTYSRINKRVNKVFYDEIKSGSYSNRSEFNEQKLAMAHFAELYEIKDLITEDGKVNSATDWYKGYIITEDFTEDDVSAFVHFDRYEDYINRKIVPSIMRDILVEQYLFNYDKDTSHILGRAYGRKVNILKISDESKYPNAATNLMDAFATQYVTSQNDASAEVDFEIVANVWRGFKGLQNDGTIKALEADEIALATASNLTIVTEADLKLEYAHTEDTNFYAHMESVLGSDFSYVKESKLGLLLDKYVLIDENNRFATDDAKSALTEFTGSLSHSKEVGFSMKIAELADDDFTTDGWYVKNGGLTDLPDAIRNRLFNINVSSEVDRFEQMETVADGTMGKYKATDYVRYINNHYYLTPETSEKYEVNPNNFVIYNGGASYIVQVCEAVTTSKLDTKGDKTYNELRKADIEANPLFTEEIAMEIAHVLGTKDSYVNDAYSHYIELYNMTYHSTAIYDYFKNKYPELFDDEE